MTYTCYAQHGAGCTALVELTLPAAMTSIGDAAFASCTSLTTVTFPAESKLTVIGDYAFRCCRSLTKLAFPDGLIAVGKYAYSCHG